MIIIKRAIKLRKISLALNGSLNWLSQQKTVFHSLHFWATKNSEYKANGCPHSTNLCSKIYSKTIPLKKINFAVNAKGNKIHKTRGKQKRTTKRILLGDPHFFLCVAFLGRKRNIRIMIFLLFILLIFIGFLSDVQLRPQLKNN